MAGALKTLMGMLSGAPSIVDNNVSIRFGEEFIAAQDMASPSIVVVPRGGSWGAPAYVRAVDPSTELQWSTLEDIDLYLWAYVPDGPGVLPVDQADAVEALRQLTLQAFQRQRAPGGLFYKPTGGRWVQMQNAISRGGRCYILTVQVEIAAVDVAPVNATVLDVTLQPGFAS